MKTIFYDKYGLKGHSYSFDFGFYNFSDFISHLSVLASVSIPRDTKLTIYNSNGFNGLRHVINNTGNKSLKIPNLTTIFPYTIVSFKIECGCQEVNAEVVVWEKIVDFFTREEGKLIGYTYYKVHHTIPDEGPPKFNPAVIIIPDLATSKDLYDCMQKALAMNKISSLVMDLRGVGTSYSTTNVTYADIIQDYRVLVNDLGLFEKKPIVLGHGFGGAIAQLWAITYPVELINLILIGSAPFPIYSTYNLANTTLNDWVSGSVTLNDLADYLTGITYEPTQECLIWEYGNSVRNINESTVKLFITQNGDNVSLLPVFQNYYLGTLLIHGLNDQYISISGSNDLVDLLNNSNNVTYYKFNTGHSPHLERMMDMVSIILQWLNPKHKDFFG